MIESLNKNLPGYAPNKQAISVKPPKKTPDTAISMQQSNSFQQPQLTPNNFNNLSSQYIQKEAPKLRAGNPTQQIQQQVSQLQPQLQKAQGIVPNNQSNLYGAASQQINQIPQNFNLTPQLSQIQLNNYQPVANSIINQPTQLALEIPPDQVYQVPNQLTSQIGQLPQVSQYGQVGQTLPFDSGLVPSSVPITIQNYQDPISQSYMEPMAGSNIVNSIHVPQYENPQTSSIYLDNQGLGNSLYPNQPVIIEGSMLQPHHDLGEIDPINASSLLPIQYYYEVPDNYLMVNGFYPEQALPYTIFTDDITNYTDNTDAESVKTKATFEKVPGKQDNLHSRPPQPNLPYIKPNGEIDVNELIKQLNKKNRATDDPNFDPNGWMKYYPQNDPFFNYDYGETVPRQTLVTSPYDLDQCTVYTGEVNSQGQKHGSGVLYSGRSIKRGDFREDQFCGWGREARKHGHVTEAKYENGVADGKGTYVNSRGNKFEGDFKDGKRCGEGTLTTNKFIYDGQFFDGQLNGKGRIQFRDAGHVYEGEFRDNEIDGYGKFTWANGDSYEGDMVRGKMEGNGRYNYANGQVYEGAYVNGVKHGKGRLIYPDGKVFEGYFKNGLPDGAGKFYENGTVQDVEFKDGKLVE